MKRILVIMVFPLIVLSMPLASGATTMLNIDRILYEADGGLADPSALRGIAQATVTPAGGSYDFLLSIVLANTTPFSAFSADSSSVWLTGLGICLPDGFSVVGGQAWLTGASGVYKGNTNVTGTVFTSSGETQGNVSREWGYLNGTSGHFNDFSAFVDTNTQFSTMTADAGAQFAPGDLGGQKNGLNGPPWGLISQALVPYIPNSYMPGAYGIVNGITITAYLTGSGLDGAGLEAWIDQHDVVLTFGSPDAIPEPATLVLLGSGLVAVCILARRRLG
ncbi:MAG: hypothetical protein Kow0025_24090 [Thermodesulfovibrionales bacterium]